MKTGVASRSRKGKLTGQVDPESVRVLRRDESLHRLSRVTAWDLLGTTQVTRMANVRCRDKPVGVLGTSLVAKGECGCA